MSASVAVDIVYYVVMSMAVYEVVTYISCVKKLLKKIEGLNPTLFRSHYGVVVLGVYQFRRVLLHEISDPRKVPIEIKEQTKAEFHEAHNRLYRAGAWFALLLALFFAFKYFEHKPFLLNYLKVSK